MGGCVLPVLDEDEGEDHFCGLGVLGGWLVRGVWVEDLGCGGGGYFGRSGDAAEVRGLGVR